jgi:hypothetical protein
MSYYYVGSGEMNKMFTLRCQYEDKIVVEGEAVMIVIDYYIRNLSIDQAKAVETAKALGYVVAEPRFSLEEIQRRAAGVAAAEFAAAKASREEAEYEARIAREEAWYLSLSSGVWPFGRLKFEKLDYDMSYVAYWLGVDSEDTFIVSMKNLLAKMFPEVVRTIALGNGNGEYVGEIKSRIKNLKGTCVAHFGFESFYGWTYITKIVLDSGELVVYKGSTCLPVEYAESVTFDATPKEHCLYEGVNQTMMLRLKFH